MAKPRKRKQRRSWHRNVCQGCYRYYRWRWRQFADDASEGLAVSYCSVCTLSDAPADTQEQWASIIEERFDA